MPDPGPPGILLAAGAGTRFGADKLLHPLAPGLPMAMAAARTLRAVVPRVVAVVRPGQEALCRALVEAGAEPVEFGEADRGMGASLAFGVSHLPEDAPGCLVSLADKPFVRRESVAAVRQAFGQRPEVIVVPAYRGRRGHPVAFGRDHLPALARLDGDAGGRQLIRERPDAVEELPLQDPGIIRDVDRREDIDAGGVPYGAI